MMKLLVTGMYVGVPSFFVYRGVQDSLQLNVDTHTVALSFAIAAGSTILAIEGLLKR